MLSLLELDPDLLEGSLEAHREFRLRVPRGFVGRMRKRDPNDPLLRQVLPLADENLPSPGFLDDPVGDGHALAAPGLLQKYAGRALLIITGACAIHCRYCFRRHFPYAQSGAEPSLDEATLEHLRCDDTQREVIFSGGDPLVLSDSRLATMVAKLEAIDHLERLRLHTRLPIVLPERIDDGLLDWLTRTRLTPVVVVHVNHAQEIDRSVAAGLRRLRDAGVTLLNQSVLLHGVNDTADALTDLSERLFRCGVLPYYLHMLDRVRGAAHFDVPELRAAQLLGELQARLPGYLVPRLVREIPGAPGKTMMPARPSEGPS